MEMMPHMMEHDGHNNEFHQVQEDGAEGLDEIGGELRPSLQQQTRKDRKQHRDEDLHGQRQFFLFLHE